MRSMTEGAVGEAGGCRFSHRSHPRVSRRRIPGISVAGVMGIRRSIPPQPPTGFLGTRPRMTAIEATHGMPIRPNEMWRRKFFASTFNALTKNRCRKRAINPAPSTPARILHLSWHEGGLGRRPKLQIARTTAGVASKWRGDCEPRQASQSPLGGGCDAPSWTRGETCFDATASGVRETGGPRVIGSP